MYAGGIGFIKVGANELSREVAEISIPKPPRKRLQGFLTNMEQISSLLLQIEVSSLTKGKKTVVLEFTLNSVSGKKPDAVATRCRFTRSREPQSEAMNWIFV